MLAELRRFAATRAFLVPTLLRLLLEEARIEERSGLSLRAIHYGAAPMDALLLKRSIGFFGCRFLQYYGMTEAGGTVTILGPGGHDPAHPEWLQTVGTEVPGVELSIRSERARRYRLDR